METDQAKNSANTLKALAHPTRLQIVAELLTGTRCVTDMEDILPASQANISQHLTVLRHAGLVDFAQDGSLRCYYLSRPYLVENIFRLLGQNLPVVHKTREQIHREKEALSASPPEEDTKAALKNYPADTADGTMT